MAEKAGVFVQYVQAIAEDFGFHQLAGLARPAQPLQGEDGVLPGQPFQVVQQTVSAIHSDALGVQVGGEGSGGVSDGGRSGQEVGGGHPVFQETVAPDDFVLQRFGIAGVGKEGGAGGAFGRESGHAADFHAVQGVEGQIGAFGLRVRLGSGGRPGLGVADDALGRVGGKPRPLDGERHIGRAGLGRAAELRRVHSLKTTVEQQGVNFAAKAGDAFGQGNLGDRLAILCP